MKSTTTPPRQLRGGLPLWADTARIKVRSSPQTRTLTCDVAIVGAGISGAIAALMLAETSKDAVVLDRLLPITGSTLASTAMIQFEIDTPLTELAGKTWRKSNTCRIASPCSAAAATASPSPP